MVAGAGDLQPVVPPFGGQPGDLFERQVGPLAGEQGQGSSHTRPSSFVSGAVGGYWPASEPPTPPTLKNLFRQAKTSTGGSIMTTATAMTEPQSVAFC